MRTIQKLCTTEEFVKYRIAIGQCAGTIVFEVLNPIVTRYPDLHPGESGDTE